MFVQINVTLRQIFVQINVSMVRNLILMALIAIIAADLISCNKSAKQAAHVYTVCAATEYSVVLHLQPLGDFPHQKAVQLKRDLECHLFPVYHCTIQIDADIDLPQSAYYKPRNRYWAGEMLKYLKPQSNEAVVVGLTDEDISTSIHGHYNYGVMGLSYRPGNSCVVSTYRLKNKRDLWKLAMHEFLHSRGLPHCKSDNPSCIMQDAHGHDTFRGKYDICEECKSLLAKSV